MKLQKAAAHFNRMLCRDAYSGRAFGYGQLGLYDDSKRDTEGGERRIIEFAGDVEFPTRRTIQAAGTHYILGHGFPDHAMGRVIRIKYVAHEATRLAKVQALDDVCLSLAGTDLWAARAWVKDSKEVDESSQMIGVNHFHFSEAETISVSDIVTFDGVMNIVRKVMVGSAGTKIATCDELQGAAVESTVLTNHMMDPVTQVATSSPIPVKVLKVRWQSLFEFKDSASPAFQPDNLQVVIAKSVAMPTVGSTLSLTEGKARVVSILDRPDVWVCRVVLNG